MKFVVAGNYSLDPSTVAMHLLRELAELPIDSMVLLRAPLTGHIGPIELLADQLCRELSIPVVFCMPTAGSGGEGTINRDYRMVDSAAGVIAYFHPDSVMNEERGTTRLVRYAIARDIPVRAFMPTEHGMDYIGSIEETSHA